MKKLIFILMLCTSTHIHAGERKFVSAYLISYPQTVVEVLTAPTEWKCTEWLAVAGVIGIGTGLYLSDEETNAFVLETESALTKDVSLAAKQFGEGKFIIPAIGATILGGYILDSGKTMDTGLLCLKSFLLANGLTTSLKFLTQRQRPNADNGKEFWNGRGFIRARDSFPSGHATVVWSLAPILAAQYKEQIWVAPLAYGIAGLTSYSRMHDNKHWVSDVFAGAVIGYVSAQFTLHGTPRFQVMPDLETPGINVSLEF